ncbi:MAG: glutamate--tRNA ligase family protein [bacterium]
MSNQKPFRTRQAPSPTGYLHLGTARTVLFTKLFALINEGKWFLRLEDTDRNRLQPEAAKNLLDCLYSLGLEADEGVRIEPTYPDKADFSNFYGVFQEGEFKPYIQSERLDLYHEHAQNLIDKKLAFWSYITPAQKEELQAIKTITKQPINYFKENLAIHPKFASKNFGAELIQEAEYDLEILFQPAIKALNDEKKPVLMYRLQRNDKVVCQDLLLGKTEFDLKLEEDFSILKSDGFPTYHLAHLIDDHLMQTSLVIRGQEWFPSTPKHVTMFKDYWGPESVLDYLHLPVIMGETGNKKMSKRDGNVNMQDYLDRGYLPEAMINYLAFLGWNPGTEKELYLNKEDF